MNRSSRRRVGSVLVCVLTCLVVALGLIVVSVRATLQAYKETRVQHQLRQAEMLVDAGVRRAVEKLRDSSEYQGETWDVSSALPNYESSIVTIQIDAQPRTEGSDRNVFDVSVTSRVDSRTNSLGPLGHAHNFEIEFTDSDKSE